MTEITASMVKELRDETGLGMMECKRALIDAGGDKAKAIQILRERGLSVATKKASRAANNGVIAARVAPDGATAALLEVNCETDFVARNEVFRSLVSELLDTALADDTQLAERSQAAITSAIQKTGENIVLRRHLRWTATMPGRLAAYVHLGDKLGVLVELGVSDPALISATGIAEVAKDLTLHVAANRPPYLDRSAVPAEVLANEREIYAKQVTNKPPQIVEKIVQGKLEKFFATVCLLEQPFVRDDKISVGQWLDARGRELGGPITVRRYVVWQLGE